MTGKFTETLAEFASGTLSPTLLSRSVGRLSALDWLACGLAGIDEPVAKILRSMAAAEAGVQSACLFGGGAGPARMAALVNGTISHALDYDDTHFAHIGHPSVAVYSAAFAMGQHLTCTLPQVLEAALVGMELSVRVGLWLGRDHYQSGFHQTATAGAFGAGVAAGRLAEFNSTQMAQLLGLTATRAAGLKAQFGTMGKPYNAGLAASTGVEVAQLVQAGFEPYSEALEGEFGFGATHHGRANIKDALAGLGEVWMFETVSHKFHACCHGLHAALEAARGLDLAAPEIAELQVRTHPRWMTVCNQTAPHTGLGAKFSYRTVLAMQALGLETAGLRNYSDETCGRSDLRALRDRIHVNADETLSETEAVINLLRRDGLRRESRYDLQSVVELDIRKNRVLDKAASLIGNSRSENAWEMLHENVPCSAFAELFGT